VIAIDTSSWIAFFSDRESPGDDTALVESALADHQACLPPVVLTELLSDPKLPRAVAALLSQLPVLDTHPEFWVRVGRLRGHTDRPDLPRPRGPARDPRRRLPPLRSPGRPAPGPLSASSSCPYREDSRPSDSKPTQRRSASTHCVRFRAVTTSQRPSVYRPAASSVSMFAPPGDNKAVTPLPRRV
jgi:predicted nucleic acid-binding protein